MPVGAGSIRRVAKAAATEPAKEVVKKTAEQKTTVATNTSEYNQVCHITEELPIYLL